MPANADAGELTRLLRKVRAGDRVAFDAILPLVYAELRRLAAAQLALEHGPRSLGATGLVHEAYLKLAEHARLDWQSRAHFFGIASRAMRQILVDGARRRRAAKRGGDVQHTALSGKQIAEDRDEELLALDDALGRLEAVDPRCRRVIEMKYFTGMTEGEIAEVLQVTERTVQRDWVRGRAWLYARLYGEGA